MKSKRGRPSEDEKVAKNRIKRRKLLEKRLSRGFLWDNINETL